MRGKGTRIGGIVAALAALFIGSLFAGAASATITSQGYWPVERLQRGASYESLSIGPDGTAYMFVGGEDRVVRFGEDGAPMRGWEIRGRAPTALAIAPEGTVLIAVDRRIERYAADGSRLKPIRLPGRSHGRRPLTHDIDSMDVAPDGSIYVVNWIDSQIVRLSPEGKVLSSFGGFGTGPGRFILPEDVAVGPDGRVYVIELDTRVQMLGPNGRFLKQWGTDGVAPGQFAETTALDVDDAGRVYVADSTLSRVQVFDPDGRYLDQIGSQGTGPGRFRFPRMLATGPNGFMVSDEAGARVQRLSYATGPHVPQAQIFFSVLTWPVESTPGRRVWLPMRLFSFGDLPAEGVEICPVRDTTIARRILGGVECLAISSVPAPGARKFGFWAKMPAGVKRGDFRHVRFKLRSSNAGGGPIGVTLYSGRDFSWAMD